MRSLVSPTASPQPHIASPSTATPSGTATALAPSPTISSHGTGTVTSPATVTSPCTTSPSTPSVVASPSCTCNPVTTYSTVTSPVMSSPISAALELPGAPAPSPVPSNIVMDMAAENQELRRQIFDLKQRVKEILDHSIESDTRLMEFTEEIFRSPNTSKHNAHCNSPTTVEMSIQCDFPVTYQDEQCAVYKALVPSLKTTVEVLEAEIQCLKSEVKNCTCGDGDESDAVWSIYRAKSEPIKLKNRYDALSLDGGENEWPVLVEKNIPRVISNSNKKKVNKKTSNVPRKNVKSQAICSLKTGKTTMSFRSLIIESDSHGRHLAGMVKELVTSETSVLGVVKLGAKLLNITSCQAPTSHSCSILIAGANDFADGQQTTIFRHLEQCIRAKLSSSKVEIGTLPHRHNLSVHH